MKKVILNFKSEEDYDDYMDFMRGDASEMKGINIDETKNPIEITFDEFDEGEEPLDMTSNKPGE